MEELSQPIPSSQISPSILARAISSTFRNFFPVMVAWALVGSISTALIRWRETREQRENERAPATWGASSSPSMWCHMSTHRSNWPQHNHKRSQGKRCFSSGSMSMSGSIAQLLNLAKIYLLSSHKEMRLLKQLNQSTKRALNLTYSKRKSCLSLRENILPTSLRSLTW